MIEAGALLHVTHRTRGAFYAVAQARFSPDSEAWPIARVVTTQVNGGPVFEAGEPIRGIRGSQVKAFRVEAPPAPLGRISTKGGCS